MPLSSLKEYLRKFVTIVADMFLGIFVVNTLVVFYWLGTWGLLDCYLYPHNPKGSAWVCFWIGNVGGVTIYLLKDFVMWLGKRGDVMFLIVTRVHVLVCGFCNVCHWRGIWMILDEYTEISVENATVCYLASVPALMIVRSVGSSAFGLSFDSSESELDPVTRFGTRWSDGPVRFTLDALFTVCVIINLTGFHWRGMWQIIETTQDIVLEDSVSVRLSCCIGYGGHVLLYTLQFILNKYLSTLTPVQRLPLDQLYLLLLQYILVNLWKGAGPLLQLYVLPEDHRLRSWISLVIGTTLLLIMGACRSIGGYSCAVENGEKENSVVIYEKYLEGIDDPVDLFRGQVLDESSHQNQFVT